MAFFSLAVFTVAGCDPEPRNFGQPLLPEDAGAKAETDNSSGQASAAAEAPRSTATGVTANGSNGGTVTPSATASEAATASGGPLLTAMVPDAGPPPTGTGTGTPAPDAGASLGSACTANTDCADSFCVDGFCCNVACDQACARCDAPGNEGTCTEAEQDEACGTLECPADSECLTYTGENVANNCVAFGQCATSATCTPSNTAETTPCQGGTGVCSGGECLVPNKKALGESCGDGDECGSTFCSDAASGGKVCCDGACGEVCSACADDGHCTAARADDDRCSVLTCPSDTACSDYNDPLTANRCASARVCVQTGVYCSPRFESSGYPCGSGFECDGAGTCESVCSSSQLWCTTQCIDPKTDSANCGVCGKSCSGGTACVQGACACTGGKSLCGSSCFDLQTDEAHCGNCSTSCAGGSMCTSGACVCPGAGQTLCGSTCLDTQTDPANCGSCGNACGTGTQCVQGDCKSWGTPFKVGDGSPSSKISVAIDSAGNGFVAYMGATTSGNSAVYVRRRAASTGTWAAAQLLDGSNTRGDSETKPQVGLDNAGNALVLWGSASGFGYSRFRNNAWSAAAFVTTPDYAASPVLSVSPAGDAFAAWDDQVAAAGTEVWFRRYGGSANAWYAAEELDQTTDQTSCLGAIASDPNGNALIVYSEAAQVYARWWSAASQTWVGARKLLNEGYCFVSSAFDGGGTSVVVSAGSANVYGSIATSQTAWTTTALAPPGQTFSYRNHVSAFAGRGGDAVVAIEDWTNFRSTLTVTWSAATRSWQGITPLMAGTASVEYVGVDLSLDAAGNGFVVSANSATGEVVGRRRDGASGSWATLETLGPRQSGTGSTVFQPRIRVDATGDALLSWLEAAPSGAVSVWARYYK